MKRIYHHPIQENNEHHNHLHYHMTDKKMLKISIAITFVAMLIQLVYSILTNSLALLSDTLHMFSHIFALGLSYFAIYISDQESSIEKTFGYYRSEVIVAFINSITTAVFVLIIIYEAIYKLFNPEIIDSKTMIIVAIFGLCVNAVTGLFLMKADMKNINIKSSFLHMMSDLLSSVGVVVAGIVVYFTNFYWIDTLVAFLIAFVIAKWSYSLIKQSINILMESSPVPIQDVKNTIKAHKNIIDVYDIHISEITHNMYILTAHIAISKSNLLDFHKISKELSNELLNKFNIGHCTFEPEY